MARDKFGPERELNDWSEKYTGLMDEMLQRSFVPYRDSGAWQPATNVYETEAAYFICVDVAGIVEESVIVEGLGPVRVVIRGRRNQPRPAAIDSPLSIHVLEIDEGPFYRQIELPAAVAFDRIITEYRQGYLWITLPKSAR